MTETLKIIVVAGARPNFMKVAPIIHEIRKRASAGELLQCKLVHTGQHYDPAMSEVFFQELAIPAPEINLGVGSGSHAAQTANVMLQFEKVCIAEQPDWVVVVGDVNSTLACSLVCAKLDIKIAHVEAGLRSFDRRMPEEVNRVVTDALADLLLTPSADADANLLREGVPAHRIKRVGNVMIDTLVANLHKARRSNISKKYGLVQRGFVYVTLHRPSNVDDPRHLLRIFEALNWLAQRLPIVFPVHPRTRNILAGLEIPIEVDAGVHMIEPVGYHDSLWLTEHAHFILTDSGGIQEESTYLGTSCLTLRPNTERPITIDIGTNQLTNLDCLATDADRLLLAQGRRGAIPELWDGKAAERIIDALVHYKH